MNGALKPQKAVAAIRVSTTKQGVQGDSPEAQKEQIKRFAAARNIEVVKFFEFLESGSQEKQPMQKAVDYCSLRKDVELFIVKSIDRFTRGGSYAYSALKMQLEACDVRLVDIYGIIGSQKVNTLEHLGVSYKWSVYDPTKNSEILEAERASDEKRDIMSRMVGAEVRYARLGYWVRKAPLGFMNKFAETMHGKRSVLEPHPIENKWFLKMFELRARGTVSDVDIVDEVNKLGFKTRVVLVRSPENRMRIIGRKGGKKLTVRKLPYYLQKPLYAGVNDERWLQGNPIRCRFDGLVSIDLFNAANRGKIVITEEGGEIVITKNKKVEMIKKTMDNPLYPYKQVVRCSGCGSSLFGSAARGQQGKYYPAYHCDSRRRGGDPHYFRATLEVFNERIANFVKNVRIAPKHAEPVVQAVYVEWARRQEQRKSDNGIKNMSIKELRLQAEMVAEKIRFCSEATIKYIERDLAEIEAQIAVIVANKAESKKEESSAKDIALYAAYFSKHPQQLLFDQPEPAQRANYFGLLFNRAPMYHQLVVGEHDSATDILSDLFLRGKVV